MIKTYSHPFFCTSTRCTCCTLRLENLSMLYDCSQLTWEEKTLWLWIATQSAKKMSNACDYSYEQISHAMNQSCKQVHRALFRLKVIGFLLAELPYWYYKLTTEMCTTVYTLKPILPDKVVFKNLKSYREDPEGFILELENSATRNPVNINLLKKLRSRNNDPSNAK